MNRTIWQDLFYIFYHNFLGNLFYALSWNKEKIVTETIV